MKTKGSALLTALFMMIMVAIATTAIVMRVQHDIFRARWIIDKSKLDAATKAVDGWAIDILLKEHLTWHTKKIIYPKKLSFIYPNIKISGYLEDAQGKFNLNNLQDRAFFYMFLKILDNALPNTPKKERRLLAEATRNWILPYNLNHGQDPWLNFYKNQKPPYLSSHQQMVNLNEFSLIKGVNNKIFKALEPYLTVLPRVTPINLNSAPSLILKSLGKGLSQDEVSQIIKARGKTGIIDLTKHLALLNALKIPPNQITIQSEYFLAHAKVSQKKEEQKRQTLFWRTKTHQNKITVYSILAP